LKLFHATADTYHFFNTGFSGTGNNSVAIDIEAFKAEVTVGVYKLHTEIVRAETF
jgi:hypothetical protein